MKRDVEKLHSEPDKLEKFSFRPWIIDALRELARNTPKSEVAGHYKKRIENFDRDLKRFREVIFPSMHRIIDVVEREQLVGAKGVSPAQKTVLTKTRRAEQGYYVGSGGFGPQVIEGIMYETKETNIVDDVLTRFLAGELMTSIGKPYNLPAWLVRVILTDPVNKGEQVYRGKNYKLNWQGWAQDPKAQKQVKHGRRLWEPPITPEQYDEIQSMLTQRGVPAMIHGLYRRKGERWILFPKERKKAEKIISMKKELQSYAAIEADPNVDLPSSVIWRFIHDERITGLIEVNGKLVDSGFEAITDHDTWKALQKIKAPASWEVYKDRTKITKEKIKHFLPAYPFQIAEKFQLSKAVVNRLVSQLISKDHTVKRRDDGLLQRIWEDFPQTIVKLGRDKTTFERREKVYSYLQKFGESTPGQIAKAVSLPEKTVKDDLQELKRKGLSVVKREIYKDRKGRFSRGKWSVNSQIQKA